jgi:uncharacterized membrane protein
MTRPISYAPMVLALGVMLALWGLVSFASMWVVSVLGLLIIAIGAARWWKESRRLKEKT